jgi:hypothetical protein
MFIHSAIKMCYHGQGEYEKGNGSVIGDELRKSPMGSVVKLLGVTRRGTAKMAPWRRGN